MDAYAANYYVSNSGDDAAAGTSVAPWAHCPGMIGWTGATTLASGDVVYFDNAGTWSSNSTTTVLFQTTTDNVTYNGSTWGAGTRAKIEATTGYTAGIANSDGPVVYIVNNTITFTGFEVDGNQTLSSGVMVGYKVANKDISTVTINNCIVHDTGSFENVSGHWPYGILVSSVGGHTTSNVNITNTTIYNTAHGGIDIYPTWTSGDPPIVDTVLIHNCTIYDTGKSADGQARFNIEVVNDSRDVTVEFCNLYNSSKHGFYYRVSPTGEVTNPPSGGIFRYNLVYNNGESGIVTNNSEGLSGMTLDVYNNIFYNNTVWNIEIDDGQSDSYPSGVFNFYNNTFLNTASSTSYGDISIGPYNMIDVVPTVNFKNNIVSVGNIRPIFDRVSGIATRTNNLLYRSSGTVLARVGASTDYTSGDIATWVGDSSTQTTDPTFTAGTLPTSFSGTYGSNMVPNTDYFQLTVDSPAKDTGATLEGYTGSINGAGLTTPIVRPIGSAFDIGAYEYGTVAQSGGSAGSGFKMQGVTIR